MAPFTTWVAAAGEAYVWARIVEAAPYPPSYNFPVHVTSDGRFAALHPDGTWLSSDGLAWTRSALPWSGTNSTYLPYLQHKGSTWTFGQIEGNYQRFAVHPVVRRTRDYTRWEELGTSQTLPHVVFYATASFENAMWLIGGFDGTRATAEVWRSTDGLNWQRMVQRAPWSPRSGAKAVVFRNRLFLIGGGVIDGPSANDVWSSADGKDWVCETASMAPENPVGYAAIAFGGQLWLIGANRSGTFSSAMLVSADGRSWRTQRAPWSPRGGVAPWTNGRDLFITGGKYSYEHNGEFTFIYSNDVWRMRRK